LRTGPSGSPIPTACRQVCDRPRTNSLSTLRLSVLDAVQKITRIPKVISVEVRSPHGLHVSFDDGLIRDVDLVDELWGPVFEPLKDPEFFAQATVDHGTVTWPNGVDLDPLVLHGDFERASSPDTRQAG
jgi:hypothetical protein